MKIYSIHIKNYLGARSVDIASTAPVQIICGANGAGKSSIRDAIALALNADLVRVDLKKHANALVTVGAEAALIDLAYDDKTTVITINKSGRITDSDSGNQPHPALPYVLSPQRFAGLPDTDRRAALFGVMGVRVNAETIAKRLQARGCDTSKLREIDGLLRGGFGAAHTEATAKARDAKTAWRTVTGEAWGAVKAETWAAVAPELGFDISELEQREQEIGARIIELNQHLGALRAANKQAREIAERIAELREKASRYARAADKLHRDETELAEWQAKVAKIEAARLSQDAMPCPCCGEMLVHRDGQFLAAGPLATGTDDDIAKLLEYRAALALLESAVANGKRDVAAADQAAKRLDELEKTVHTTADDSAITAAEAEHTALIEESKQLNKKTAVARQVQADAASADKRTTQALEHHRNVLAWTAIADALAPDGIPAEVLRECLTPINDWLAANRFGGLRPEITADIHITAWHHGLCVPYALLSESERWRVDVMLAAAIAHFSGVKLLVLDRFDVLDLTGRGEFLGWLDDLVVGHHVDSAIVFGTTKALPSGLPETMTAHWVENGVCGELQEAA